MKIEFSLKFRENWTNILEIPKSVLEISKISLKLKKWSIVGPKTQNFRLRRANCLDLYKNQKIFTLDVLDQAPEQYIEDKIVKNSVENYKMTSKIAISDTKNP